MATGTRRNARKQTAKAPATAPGQLLGYGLQYTRLTAMLLAAAPGTACALEVLDDVSQTADNGNVTLVQTKSALTANPVSDRAIPLWKTLANWVRLSQLGFVDPASTVFEVYVSREVTGDLIAALASATSLDAAKACAQRAREQLWGAAPKYPDKAALPADLANQVNVALEASDAILLPIIKNLVLQCAAESPQRDIEQEIARGPVSASRVFDIADKMCGWVKRTVDKQLEGGRAAVISYTDFHREYVAYVRSIDRDIVLKSWARRPSELEKIDRLPDMFVRQLDLIEIAYDEKLSAISDYLMACADRAQWSKLGEVHESSFEALNGDLCRVWGNLHRAVGIEASSKSETDRGQLLHSRCLLHKARLQGMEVESHFVPGCFHMLANDLEVGWHPQYRRLLKR